MKDPQKLHYTWMGRQSTGMLIFDAYKVASKNDNNSKDLVHTQYTITHANTFHHLFIMFQRHEMCEIGVKYYLVTKMCAEVL